MCIRRATKKDLPKIIKIIKDSFHRQYAAAGEFYSVQQFADSNYGSGTGPYYSLKFFIKDMVRNLKNKLRKPFKFLVAEENKKPLYLWVNAKNPALKFWKKLGFKEVLREVLMIKK